MSELIAIQPSMTLASIAILIGFVGLIWSADRFVDGSAAIARSFGVTPLVIGLTIVSFGTSAPEVFVSIDAALNQAGGLAVGNALGSNIANIALVLAVTMLVAAIPVQRHILQQEMSVLILVTLASGYVLYDGYISFAEGLIFLLALIPTIGILVWVKKKELSPAEVVAETDIPDMGRKLAFAWFIIGLVILIISSKTLVWGAEFTAQHFGVDPLIIGITVVAVGTSLPELAASVISALKGHHDIALGNIVGSNIFNLLAVLAIPGIIHPPEMDVAVFYRDFMVTLFVTVVLAAAVFISLKRAPGKQRLGKATGALLLIVYLAYYAFLFVGEK